MPAATWWTRRASARWDSGGSRRGSWRRASPRCGRSSATASTATAAMCPSRAARSAPPWTGATSRRTGSAATTRCCSSSRASLGTGSDPGPAIPVAVLHLLHHPGERLIEIDPLAVGHAAEHEEDVGHLHGEIALRLVGLLRLAAEAVIHLARQLTHLLGPPGELGERFEVP